MHSRLERKDVMQQEHLAEWISLRDEAIRELGNNKGLWGYTSRLCALVLPSFEDACRYELFAPVQDANAPALAVKMVWRFSEDNAKFASPLTRLRHGPGVKLLPTIQEYRNEIDTRLVEDLCQRAAALQITPWPATQQYIGLDGTTYELAVGDRWPACRLKWWGSPPKGWEPLGRLLEQIVAACT
jgi:hypothetical protein